MAKTTLAEALPRELALLKRLLAGEVITSRDISDALGVARNAAYTWLDAMEGLEGATRTEVDGRRAVQIPDAHLRETSR